MQNTKLDKFGNTVYLIDGQWVDDKGQPAQFKEVVTPAYGEDTPPQAPPTEIARDPQLMRYEEMRDMLRGQRDTRELGQGISRAGARIGAGLANQKFDPRSVTPSFDTKNIDKDLDRNQNLIDKYTQYKGKKTDLEDYRARKEIDAEFKSGSGSETKRLYKGYKGLDGEKLWTDQSGANWIRKPDGTWEPYNKDFVDTEGTRRKKTSDAVVKMGELKFEEQKSEKLQTKVRNFSADLEKSNIPTLSAATQGVLDVLPPPGKDIPGFGASGWVPNILLTKRGSTIRQAMAKVFNIVLKDRSGAAVTTPELGRLKNEFGAGIFKTDAELLQGIRAYVLELKSIAKNRFAGVSDVVKKAYLEGGGTNFQEMLSNLGKRIDLYKKHLAPTDQIGDAKTAEQKEAVNETDRNTDYAKMDLEGLYKRYDNKGWIHPDIKRLIEKTIVSKGGKVLATDRKPVKAKVAPGTLEKRDDGRYWVKKKGEKTGWKSFKYEWQAKAYAKFQKVTA